MNEIPTVVWFMLAIGIPTGLGNAYLALMNQAKFTILLDTSSDRLKPINIGIFITIASGISIVVSTVLSPIILAEIVLVPILNKLKRRKRK